MKPTPCPSRGRGGCSLCLQRAVEAFGHDWKTWRTVARRNYRRFYRRAQRAVLRQDPVRYAQYLAQNVLQVSRSIARRTDRQKADAKAYHKRYKQRPDVVARRRERQRRQRQANPKLAYATVKAWRQRHPEQWREIDREAKHRRQAQKRGAHATFTRADWQRMLELYNHRCVYCGKKSQRLTQDHVVPLAQGGPYTWDNIVPACRACNTRKLNRKAPLFQLILPLK